MHIFVRYSWLVVLNNFFSAGNLFLHPSFTVYGDGSLPTQSQTWMDEHSNKGARFGNSSDVNSRGHRMPTARYIHT